MSLRYFVSLNSKAPLKAELQGRHRMACYLIWALAGLRRLLTLKLRDEKAPSASVPACENHLGVLVDLADRNSAILSAGSR